MESDEQNMIEKVFENSPNDFATVLAIASRARQILEEYPKYEEKLEDEKATMIALEEFVAGRFTFEADFRKNPNDED